MYALPGEDNDVTHVVLCFQLLLYKGGIAERQGVATIPERVY